MAHLMLGKILEGVSDVKKDGAAYLLPEELDANVFVALGQEVLQVARLSRVEPGGDVVVLVTQKGERFYFPPEQIIGIRFGAPQRPSRGSAGFSR
ncbi:MAG TPA: hypothetical protein VII38_15715 [Polyangia bacterium]|jgi:hypothetical protein